MDLPLIGTMKHTSPKPQGRTFVTPGVRVLKVRVTVRSVADTNRMRAEFAANGGPRQKYLDRMKSPTKTSDAELKAIGMSKFDIAEFRKDGVLPTGYQVHHRVPLKVGGTNRPDIFIIIRDDPEHKLFTAHQNARVRNMDGQTIDLEIPVPPPNVNVWPQPGSQARLTGSGR